MRTTPIKNYYLDLGPYGECDVTAYGIEGEPNEVDVSKCSVYIEDDELYASWKEVPAELKAVILDKLHGEINWHDLEDDEAEYNDERGWR
jgi:hypothetical protein